MATHESDSAPRLSQHPAPARASQAEDESGSLDRLEQDLLAQTAEVVKQVRSQLADLERREKGLGRQLGELDQERRAFRLEQQQFENQTSEAREEIESRRHEVAVESDRLRSERIEIASDRSELLEERRELELERARIREEVLNELAAERHELESGIAELALEDEAQRKLRDEIEKERQRLQDSSEARRSELEQELAQRRQQFEDEIASERSVIEERANEQAVSEEIQRDREQLQKERRSFEQSVAEWFRQKELEEADLRRRRQESEDFIERAEKELHELRQSQWQQIDDQRRQQEIELRKAGRVQQQELDQELIRTRKQLALEESRVRFQRDHLERLRLELERAQDELHVEGQSMRQHLETVEDTQRRRSQQLDRRCLLLEQRETALERQSQTIAELQQSIESAADRQHEALASAQSTWELKQQAQAAEHRRQVDLLASHAELLETRRGRLDQTRDELEKRHLALLEAQSVFEAIKSRFAEAVGQSTAAELLETARNSISPVLEDLRSEALSERRRLDELAEESESHLERVREEKAALHQLISEHETQLGEAERQMGKQLADLQSDEERLAQLRLDWLSVRRDDEQTLLGLLEELKAQVGDDSSPTPLPNQLDELTGGQHSDAA